jgi:hypothetical protein
MSEMNEWNVHGDEWEKMLLMQRWKKAIIHLDNFYRSFNNKNTEKERDRRARRT